MKKNIAWLKGKILVERLDLLSTFSELEKEEKADTIKAIKVSSKMDGLQIAYELAEEIEEITLPPFVDRWIRKNKEIYPNFYIAYSESLRLGNFRSKRWQKWLNNDDGINILNSAWINSYNVKLNRLSEL